MFMVVYEGKNREVLTVHTRRATALPPPTGMPCARMHPVLDLCPSPANFHIFFKYISSNIYICGPGRTLCQRHQYPMLGASHTGNLRVQLLSYLN